MQFKRQSKVAAQSASALIQINQNNFDLNGKYMFLIHLVKRSIWSIEEIGNIF